MTRRTRIISLSSLALAVLAALPVAACGGSSSAPPARALPKSSSGHAATVGVANTTLGTILVDSQGRTLYLFKRDSGTRSSCFGECASNWPPLRAHGKPTVAGGAKASLVATTSRSDRPREVTYNRHPVYLFVGDKQPGDTNGQDITAFGAAWFGVSPAGSQISGQASNSAGGTSSSGGLGY
jgi:predicted lipoprotein with Yx(FWY)xxD motif